MSSPELSTQPESLPPADLLRGAAAIAKFLLNDTEQRRTIYHWAEKGVLPAFRLGGRIYARRSTLSSWIAGLEAASNGPSSNRAA